MFRFVQRKYEEDAILEMHYDFNYVKILLHRKELEEYMPEINREYLSGSIIGNSYFLFPLYFTYFYKVKTLHLKSHLKKKTVTWKIGRNKAEKMEGGGKKKPNSFEFKMCSFI